MATRANKQQLKKNSVDILNAVRNSASQDYKDTIPVASEDIFTIREIGSLLVNHHSLRNEFVNLINRIGLTVIRSRIYNNPFSVFKIGTMDLGETIQEIYVDIASVRDYSITDAGNREFAFNPPDVLQAFHSINYKKQYYVSKSEVEFKQAFTSIDGVYNFITAIVQSIFNAVAYDEYISIKYMIELAIVSGRTASETFEAGTTPLDAVTKFRKVSNDMLFYRSDLNELKVNTFTPREEQYILLTSEYDAIYDVQVLASAFNMSKAEFLGHKLLVDSWAVNDEKRLKELYGDKLHVFTTAEKSLLAEIPAIIIDKYWLVIVDNVSEMREAYVNAGMYVNSFYDAWRTFSISPFHNAVVFTGVVGTIENVKVNGKGNGEQLEIKTNPGADNNITLKVTADFTGVISRNFECAINGKSTNAVGIEILKIANDKFNVYVPEEWMDTGADPANLFLDFTYDGGSIQIELDIAHPAV